MPLGFRELFLVIILPGLAALLILTIGRRAWRKDLSDEVGRWAAPVATGVAFLIAFPSVVGGFDFFPPKESVSWLFPIAIILTIAAIIDAILSRVWIARFGATLLLGVGSAYLVLKFRVQPMPAFGALMLLSMVGLLASGWWAALDFCEQDEHSPSAAPWIFWLTNVAIAMVLAMNGSLKHAQLAGALAAAAGAGLLLSLVRGRAFFSRGSALAFAILPVLLIVGAHYLIDVPMKYVAPLLAAPVAVMGGRILPVSRLRPSLLTAMKLAPLIVLMATVTVMSAIDFSRQQKLDEASDPYAANRARLKVAVQPPERA